MKKVFLALICFAVAVVFISCSSKSNTGAISGPDDLVGKRIGVQLGTTSDIYVSELGDGTTVERYVKNFEVIQALKQGKIDVVVMDREPAKIFVSQNDDLKILEAEFSYEEYALAFAKKNTQLRDDFNKAISQLKEDGTIDALDDYYIKQAPDAKRYTSPKGIKYTGKLAMATNAEFPPYEFIEGKEIVGFDVDLARAISDKLGKELVVVDMHFDSIIPAVEAGKVDFGAAGITITEDRKKSVEFSNPYYNVSLVIIIKK